MDCMAGMAGNFLSINWAEFSRGTSGKAAQEGHGRDGEQSPI